MIIEPKPDTNTVMITRLVTGETVVTRVEKTDTGYVFIRPRIVQIIQSPQGYGAQLVPLTAPVQEDIAERYSIPLTALLYEPVKAEETIAANYTTEVSKILVPPQNGIIL